MTSISILLTKGEKETDQIINVNYSKMEFKMYLNQLQA